MSQRRSWRTVAGLVTAALALGSFPVTSVSAQAPTTVQVAIEPMGGDGVSGLALLSPASQGGTSIQILVSGAPAETFAVIHAGSCDAIDPAPVALLGDVSRASQAAVTNAFETLADGRHVLALHAGLDLATAVGCGAIPAVAVASVPPGSEQTEEPAAQGGTFSGSLTGFGITWPAGWERYEVVEVEGQDRIGLGNGFSSMLLAARVAPGEEAQTCVRNARQALFDRLDAGTLRDLTPVTDATGAAASGVETDRAWLAYRYVSVAQDGEADIADHLECRRSGDVMLYILHRSAPEDYDRATEARDELLTGVTLPDGPRPAPTPVVGGGSYTAPTVGFTITWDGSWTKVPVTGLEAYEHIGLSRGPSRVVVSGVIDPAWDALACAMDSDANFQVQASTGTMTDLEPLVEVDGSRVRGGDAARAWIGYRYTDAATGGAVAEYHECRAANGVVVRIQHRSLPDVYQQEAEARNVLLTGLSLPDAPPATLAPAPNPECEGYAAWHETTVGRVDELRILRSEEVQAVGDLSESGDLTRYLAVLKKIDRELGRLRADQERQTAPMAAQDAQGLAVAMFERYGTAARILTTYYETNTDLPTFQRAQDSQKAAVRAQQDFEDALVAVEAVCG